MYGQCGVLIITLITRLWGESSGRYELTTVCLSVCVWLMMLCRCILD